MYTLDEIISSIGRKPLRAGFRDAPSDNPDPREYLSALFGPTPIRVHRARVALGSLRILQPGIEMWRYLRLCSLARAEFDDLCARQPLTVVRGQGIEGFPLLQGNHRALYALLRGIESAPARVFMLVDKEAAFRFQCACQSQYAELDKRFGGHGVGALREAYKDLLSQVVELRQRKIALAHQDLFSIRTKRYRLLRAENESVSAEIPCISLDGYVRTILGMFPIPASAIRISEEDLFYRYLVMTQASVEAEKLGRICASPRLFDAPILVVRTQMLDYVAAGHTRLRGRLDAGVIKARALVIHAESDALNGFLDAQATQAGHLVGNPGIRQLTVLSA